MLGFQRTAGAAVWAVLLVCKWLHAQFIDPVVSFFLDTVLGSWEESIKAGVRETCALVSRFTNACSAAAVSLFLDRRYYSRLRTKHTRPSAWQAWWQQQQQAGGGTFNAVVERDGLVGGARRASAAPGLRTPRSGNTTPSRGTPTPTSTLDRDGWVRSGSSGSNSSSGKQASAAAPTQRSWLQRWWPRSRAVTPKGHGGTSGGAAGEGSGLPPGLKRSGSELFDRPSGYALAESSQRRRGLLEDTRLGLELAVTLVFDGIRSGTRSALLMPKQAKGTIGRSGIPSLEDFPLRAAKHASSAADRKPAAGGGGSGPPKRRTRSFGSWEDLRVWTASDVILAAGYPLEEHVVETSDGYILQVQRIPRKGARDVVFFQHGLLDTSLGWVCNGIVGSQAFAAWDAGFDVFLGNSRSNPPLAHADPSRSGARYWYYSMNELGMEDIAAQIDHIHVVKTSELKVAQQGGGGGGMRMSGSIVGGSLSPVPSLSQLRRSGSDSALAAMHHQSMLADPYGKDGRGLQPPNEQAVRQHNLAADAAASLRPLAASLDSGMASGGLRQRSAAGAAAAAAGGGSRGRLRIEVPGATPPGALAEGWERRAASPFAGGSGSGSNRGSGSGSGLTSAQRLLRDDVSRCLDGVRSFALKEEALGDSEGGQEGQGEAVGSGGAPASASAAPSDEPGAELPQLRRTASSAANSSAAAKASRAVSYASPSPSPRACATADSDGSFSARMTPDKVAFGGVEQAPEQEAAASQAAPGWPRFSRLLSRSPSAQASQEGATGLEAAAAPGPSGRSVPPTPEAYRLQAVGHSLGAATLLIYAVMCRALGRPNRLSRMVLLTPAGFHFHYPTVVAPFVWVLPVVMWLLRLVRPGLGAPAYIPSSLLRYITFKLTLDLQQIPALDELTRAGIRVLLSGDKSEWDKALQMPHYNTYSMPAISLHTGAHFIQLIRSKRFLLYDYGTAAENSRHYGQPSPPDIAAQYAALAGLPVDLVAGKEDGIIGKEDVHQHYLRMRAAGLAVSYKEFDVGHLDVTFAVKDEVRHYVLSRLQLGAAAE